MPTLRCNKHLISLYKQKKGGFPVLLLYLNLFFFPIYIPRRVLLLITTLRTNTLLVQGNATERATVDRSV